MKEFSAAVEDVQAEEERQAAIEAREEKVRERVNALIGEGMDPVDAEIKAENEEPQVEGEEKVILFKLLDRVMHAYQPLPAQLAFLMAGMGRGQSSGTRLATSINLLTECLREDDRDFFESRMLTRDPKLRVPEKTIGEVFEFLMEEWFARPTQQSSGSAS